MNTLLRLLACVPLLFPIVNASAADADASYPNKPVRLVVGFAPGGPADTGARVLAEGLQGLLNQTFIVENRAGAGGNIASQYVAKERPDGYTLLVATASLTINPFVSLSAGYDVIKDFTPLAIIATQPNVVVINSKLPVKTVPELRAYVKANKTSFASSGLGTSSDLTARYLFNMQWGSDIISVPYKGGGPAAIALASGEPPISLTTITGVLPLHREGRVKILAIIAEKRLPALPEIPTMAELGYSLPSSWTALFGPAGMSDALVQKLNKAVAQLGNSATYRDKFNSQLMAVSAPKSPAELKKMLEEEVVSWGHIVKTIGLVKQ